ncbi:MAG: FkbM family methyltransferase [Verrucomicrobiota bacterium]|nr:FkbM family methyltransferase [Verrucomicrobiota bacterium]
MILKICKELTQDKKDHFFFDVGANIGLYTWEVAKICPDLKIMVFEPDPNNIELLQITNGLTGSDRIKLCSFALSNKCQETAFEQDYLTSATGSIATGNQSWIEKYLNGTPNKIKIQTRTLDQIVEEEKCPILIKIDVEGHENEVLEGGIRTIRESKPLLIIESFPPKQAKLIMALREIGYKINDADKMSAVQDNTVNLFAWHPQGPLEDAAVQKIIAS